MGVEPTRPPWQGDRLPLHHGRFLAAEMSKIVNAEAFAGHRAGIEPALPHYECGVLAAGRPVRIKFGGLRCSVFGIFTRHRFSRNALPFTENRQP